MSVSIESRLNQLESAVLAAAEYQIRMLASGCDLAVQLKSDSSLVTTLDLESQKIIRDSLGSQLDTVGEEDVASHKLLEQSDQYFVIDPLDGTTACKRFTNIRGGQVGFGPVIGYVQSGKLLAASFYNVPQRTLISAIRGAGCFLISMPSPQAQFLPELTNRTRVIFGESVPLKGSAILFHSATGEELSLVSNLMKNKIVETAYRFGGFANDCQRLACGYEQLQIQYTVKAWDFSATLFESEAGLEVLCDPLGRADSYADWKVKLMNPIITAAPAVMPEVKQWLSRSR